MSNAVPPGVTFHLWKWLPFIVLAVNASLPAITIAQTAVPKFDEPGEWASTHILARCRGNVAAIASPGFARLNNRWKVSHCKPLFEGGFRHSKTAEQLGMVRMVKLEVPAGTDTTAMVREYAALGDFEWVGLDAVGGVAEFIPNDPDFDFQWSMQNTSPPPDTGFDIDATDAWMIHTCDGDVTIAIVDSGVDPHPEFSGRLVQGINTSDPNNPNHTTTVPLPGGPPRCPHGTHVAGIAAAAGNNGLGIAGVCWGAKIMPVRVLNGCSGFESNVAAGIVWATDHGADVINLSLQFPSGSPAFESAVNYAVEQGVVVVAATGNLNQESIAFPARYENAIAVGATNISDLRAGFSNYGMEIDLCAPGDDIWSTLPPSTYGSMDGTSMAAPHVSGLAALLRSYNPYLSVADIRRIMITTAKDLGSPGWDKFFGAGRVNAFRALQAARIAEIQSSDPPDGAIDARQPFELDGSFPQGWQTVDLTFDGDLFRAIVEDFVVSQEGGVGPTPVVSGISVVARDAITVILDRAIEIGAWTAITHIPSGTSIRLGALPGDVNADGTTNAADIDSLLNELQATEPTLPIWSTDMDRSDSFSILDLPRLTDLLLGAEAYPPFDGMSLPSLP
ncbi:MAG: S8 family serine peptidase [Planctomycetota bacterium]